ncbi:hypothetical protein CMT42_15170 [Elizabethkingia anophelis]|uniref:hypothetical protein n=1 Tax=Elizabethkingia anophelis TaxID=1117645 RepID=UPI000994946B|nr:hypothetical protein [Elizabethkingia anophelis]AQW96810.1 hypothetical protein BBD31_02400 [Elizabethkingia anophelis]AQX90744.1 hypothetical protein AYC67_17780 [Elizabethkingia anophelis]ASV80016.1 hypothetical protein A6J37_16125 [Elizabethkingia anophelis]AVF48243.1 hypothetical protein AL491_09225 [Elizabethkingia anophelis]AVF52237.1 hypothetical protein AL492_11635 [Elizabethkingia anophelis]
MKKITIIFYFLGTLCFAQNANTAIDYYIQHKDGYRLPQSPITSVAMNTKAISEDLTADQKDIKELKDKVLALQKEINQFKTEEVDKNRIMYASCITSVPYLQEDLNYLSLNLENYKNTIKIIKERNLLNKPEFKKWFSMYNDFLSKQGDFKIDLIQIFNFKTTNVVDFIFSAVSSILTSNKTSKDLKTSSADIFKILNSEASFYNRFESQIESKYLAISADYNKLNDDLAIFKKGKEDFIPTQLSFNFMQEDPFVENLNKHFEKLSSIEKGRNELRDDKIYFYNLLQKYLSLKEDFRVLNKSFSEIANESVKNNVSSQAGAIESQLKKVFIILNGV